MIDMGTKLPTHPPLDAVKPPPPSPPPAPYDPFGVGTIAPERRSESLFRDVRHNGRNFEATMACGNCGTASAVVGTEGEARCPRCGEVGRVDG